MSTLATSNLKNASATNPNIVLNSDGTIGGDCLTQTCRAWVNFDGTGTPSIRGQYNVSSITDNGTGDYTVNFTTALADANFCAVAVSGNLNAQSVANGSATTFRATGSVRVYTNNAASLVDRDEISVAVFR